MKKYLPAFIALLISTGSVSAQQQLTGNQEAVQQTVIRMFDALANRDTTGLKTYFSSGALLFEYGKVWTIDTLLQGIRQNRAADYKRINTLSFIDTKVNTNTAWTTYNNQADVTQNGKQVVIKWIETVILVKEEKGWKIKVLHSTLIKRS